VQGLLLKKRAISRVRIGEEWLCLPGAACNERLIERNPRGRFLRSCRRGADGRVTGRHARRAVSEDLKTAREKASRPKIAAPDLPDGQIS
jgi:hypothetical protein